MSAYKSDLRVAFHDDGTVTIPVQSHDGDWTVFEDGGRWTASNPGQGRLYVSFRTCDQMIETIVGAPQVTA